MKKQNYQLNNPLFIFIGYWVHPCASFANLFPQAEPSEAPKTTALLSSAASPIYIIRCSPVAVTILSLKITAK